MRDNHKAIILLTATLSVICLQSTLAQQRNARSAEDQLGKYGISHLSHMAYRSEEPDFHKVNDPSGSYLRILLPGHHSTSETGKPELPVYSQLIEVPSGMSVKVILSDITSQRLNLSDYGSVKAELYPVQPAETKNEIQDKKIRVKDLDTYNTKGILAHDTVVITSEGIFRGHHLANIAVYPAFYDPSGGYVDLITSMNMDIRFVPDMTKGDDDGSAESDKDQYSSDSYITGYTDSPENMIIVTDSSFSRYLRPLIKWKTLKGIRTTLIYRKTGSADSMYYDLKKKITDFYNNSLAEGNQVHYLLIVGDPSIIPTSRGTSNISDLYYGEFDGESDYIPELFIGRLPVSDTTALKGMVSKIVEYETYNYNSANDFWSGVLATAGNDDGYETYMNGQVNYIYNNYLSKDTSLNAVRWLYPDSPEKDDSLKILFNNGLCLLNYTGHGESSGFSDPVFKASSVASLTNVDKYPLIIANACRTAQINVTPCFGSTMVNASGKGAIGYIGCTNDSYWSDDFYWAVGPGTPGLNVTYETTGLGAFDRFFHTHSESPGDWYYTMGQINFAGNMAVSASTSQRKKYYWETYILLGDPSLTPITGRPDTFNINVPDTIPKELGSLSFFAEPFAYAAISDFDTLWDAKFVSPSGNISLTIPGGDKDSCLLVITGQDRIPFIKTIRFAPVTGAFVTMSNVSFDDSSGDNDGQPDYGEVINLKVTIKNLGKSASSDLNADLSVASGLITVDSGSAEIGILSPGDSVIITDKFIFTVSDEVEDGELASLLLDLTDNGDDYHFGIDMTLSAPKLSIISSIHDDSSTGNSNFLPDPGETINLNVKVRNDGSSSADGKISVTPSGSLLSLEEAEMSTGIIPPGEDKIISFKATVSAAASSGTVLPYDVRIECGHYNAEGTWSISTGKTRETWEFNRFDVFPWIQSSDYPWTITSSTSYENTNSARSGIIPDKAESILSIYVNNPVTDTLSFYARISSEPYYDELLFRVDSVNDMEISGDIPWALRKRILKPGIHLLEWVYKKDISMSGGLDAAWIDQITFPDISFLEADLHVDTVYSPPATPTPAEVTISGRVINFGRNSLTSFPLAYRINDGDLVNETFYDKIDPGDTVDVSFTQQCTLLPEVNYLIYIINCLPEDGYSGNDTAYISYIRSGMESELQVESLQVIPNPFRESFVLALEISDSKKIEFDMINSQGKIVMRSSTEPVCGSNRIPFDCRNLIPGLYTLRICQGGKCTSVKVVKQ